jgi:hypothetical protein
MIDRLVKVKSKLNSSQQNKLFFYDNLYLATNALSFFLKERQEIVEKLFKNLSALLRKHLLWHIPKSYIFLIEIFKF